MDALRTARLGYGSNVIIGIEGNVIRTGVGYRDANYYSTRTKDEKWMRKMLFGCSRYKDRNSRTIIGVLILPKY